MKTIELKSNNMGGGKRVRVVAKRKNRPHILMNILSPDKQRGTVGDPVWLTLRQAARLSRMLAAAVQDMGRP